MGGKPFGVEEDTEISKVEYKSADGDRAGEITLPEPYTFRAGRTYIVQFYENDDGRLSVAIHEVKNNPPTDTASISTMLVS